MDCNKEEATRAKVIAEKKMENKDFFGAHKAATKAQHLHPELENIGQIICVCQVHCSAENKKLVNEKDWYGILQVEQSADDMTIKKQYRKFALLLHPDKNKFPGAEAAFKLVGEAQRVLLDREKRSFYDGKYRRFVHPNKPPAQPYKHPNFPKQPWAPPSYAASSNLYKGTTCPCCFFYFQYHKDVKPVRCPRCQQLSTPVDSSAQYGKSNQTATYTRVDISNQGVKMNASDIRFQANHGQPSATSGQSKEDGGSNSKEKEFSNKNSTPANPVKKENSKKGKKRVIEEVSSDSFESDSSTDFEDTETDKKTPNDTGNQRRSSRSKPRVSYNENGSDDDEIKANGSKPVVEEDKVKENGDAENGYESEESDSVPAKEEVVVPDPDFTNFDKLREETPFKAGQLWALYDDKGALPRFYAEIRRVYASGKKVRINWLESDPDEGNSLLWVEKDLPYACGKFSYGQAENIEDIPSFSHLMLPKLAKNVPIRIYPKSNQTWALFRDWSMDWISKADTQMDFEYDFVEVLSEYDETVGIRVVSLYKLKGFTCVFCRKGGDAEVQIPPNELLRFSHNVPSCRIEGKEMEGVPHGSIELDPASLPASLLNK